MIRFERVSFAWKAGVPALVDVSLELPRASITCLVGANGSGKSTLLRLIQGAVAPTAGTVVVQGVTVDGTDACRHALASLVGSVRQDYTAQIVQTTVADDVAFAPRNLGLQPEDVQRRVHEALGQVGLQGYEERACTQLSGGEQARLAFAGVLAQDPAWLLLDEISASLDEAARQAMWRLVLEAQEHGKGCVWATHLPEEVALASRVVVMDRGAVAWTGSPADFFASSELLELAGFLDNPLAHVAHTLALASPAVSRLALEPVGQLAQELAQLDTLPEVTFGVVPMHQERQSGALETAGITVEGPAHPILDHVAFVAPAGQITLVVGASGSGKTTLCRVLAGVLAPSQGEVLLNGTPVHAGRVGLAFQRSADALFSETVAADVAFGPKALGMSPHEVMVKTDAALRAMALDEELWQRSPFELSGGQARRAGLAAVLASGPSAYVFDEPTAGLDGTSQKVVVDALSDLAASGAAVVVTTHELTSWLELASRLVVLSSGRVVWQGAIDAHLGPAGLAALLQQAGLVPPRVIALAAAGQVMGALT